MLELPSGWRPARILCRLALSLAVVAAAGAVRAQEPSSPPAAPSPEAAPTADAAQQTPRFRVFTQARYQLALAYQRSGNAEKAREHRAIYDRLIREEKARTIGVRGSGS